MIAAVAASMQANIDLVVAISSTLLRIFSYLFLRWIPGHPFPPIILTLAAVHWTSFIRSFLSTSPFEVIADKVDVVTRDSLNQAFDTDDEESPIAHGKHETLQELDVTETVKLKARPLRPLTTLILGLPSPVSLPWTMITSSVNLALVLMTLDMVYRAPLLHEEHELVFSRVGFVSFDSARILVREPRVSELPLFLSYRYADNIIPGTHKEADTAWKHAQQIDDLTIDTDFTASAEITHLVPDTRYQYIWSNNQSGVFTTAAAPGRFSSNGNSTFTFLFSSCIKPRVPYSPLDHPLHFKGLQHIANAIPTLSPQFMLFLGDFIYIDVPKRLGVSPETYRAEYRRVYASPDWPAATENLPWLHVIDDHEIANDWDGNTTGLYVAAVDPWHHYQVAVNPPAPTSGVTFFTFTQGPVTVFMLDTRRYRTPESQNATDPTKSMLGPAQLKHLLSWVTSPPPTGVKWKVIVSSVPFTKNWRFGDTDTWGTYLHERQVILEAAWSASLAQGVGMIVISGDRHEFAATRLVDETGSSAFAGAQVMEFSVSPLNMFYLPTRTYYQRDEADQQVEYIPTGNSKFGAMQFSVNGDGSAILDFRLFIDGREKYTQRVVAPTVKGWL